jgi:hypothetical protein
VTAARLLPVPRQLLLAAPGYGILLLLAALAFWPGYLAVPKRELGGWVHFHAATATLWMLLLVAQPLAIRRGHYALHRRLGRLSPLLALFVVAGFVGLAHSQLQGKTGSEFATDAYFGYVRLVIVTLFVVTYVLGWLNRRSPQIHARYMICTGLSVIDPIFHRIAARLTGFADHNYQILTFGIVFAVLIALIVAERKATTGRHVFPAVLAAYFVCGLPLFLDFYEWTPVWTAWKAAVASFARLPIP